MPEKPSPMLAREAGAVGAGLRSAAHTEEGLLPPDADPDTLVDEILALLSAERYQSARRLAAAALERFPEHVRVERAWSIFDSRGKARAVPARLEPKSRKEELRWLSNPPESARGKWVALLGSEVVGMSESLAELTERIRPMNLPHSALVHYIE